jgi:DNA invertase Pin-like site-specific DNA recombinase
MEMICRLIVPAQERQCEAFLDNLRVFCSVPCETMRFICSLNDQTSPNLLKRIKKTCELGYMSVNGNKTIAYIRVSSQRQVDEGNSLEAQKRRIIQLAQFKGLSIAPEDFLIEKGVSAGIPLWERPMGRVLRRKLLSGKYSNLIAMKLDRLFRITTDMFLTVQEVEDMGVRLLIADLGGEAIDTSTSTGRFMLTIFGGIAEMERGLISERTQEGMAQLKAQNKRFTESIFGWDVNEDGMLEPNWYEQDLIDWMDWQIEDNGMSAAAVARSLNSRGITGKRGGRWQG